jgi:hypothetical protein
MSDNQLTQTEGGYAVDPGAPSYELVINMLLQLLRPRTYFEIGTSAGTSLALPECHCIAVDVDFKIEKNVIGRKPVCHFFQMASDRFFRDYSPIDFFKAPIDMAFLDGMHLFEFLLRDFAKTEKFCRPNSVIMLHDCIPSDRFMTVRREGDMEQRNQSIVPGWWTGDVWKAVVILNKYRPDLRIYPVNTPPTGLILVTGLDPTSTALEKNHFSIVEEFSSGAPTEPSLDEYLRTLEMIHPTELDTIPKIARYLWM